MNEAITATSIIIAFVIGLVMNEEQIRQVRQIVRDELHEILDQEILGSLLEAFNGLEAIAVQFKHSLSQGKASAAVKEETFMLLKFEPQRGAQIGSYDVAYKANNIEEKWTHAFNVLRQNNSTINSRYHGPAYVFSYWLYGESKIYRQKLKQP
jgi:hypothetical protein